MTHRHQLADLRNRAEPFGYHLMVRVARGVTSPTLVRLTDASGETAAWRIGPACKLDMMLDQIQREFFAHVWASACQSFYGDAEHAQVH